MAEDKPETDKGIGRPHIIGGIIGALAVTAVYSGAVWWMFGGFENASNFGESFGGLNAVASALATIGVVAALLLQQRQLTLQRQELSLQRAEMRAAREEQKKSAEALAAQVAVMRETARAARAQTAALGVRGAEPFAKHMHLALMQISRFLHKIDLGGTQALRNRDIDSLEHLMLPVLPAFGSDEAFELAVRFRELSKTLMRTVLRPIAHHGKQAVEEEVRAAMALARELESELRETTQSYHKAVRGWCVDIQCEPFEPEIAQSGERPVTAPEEQAS